METIEQKQPKIDWHESLDKAAESAADIISNKKSCRNAAYRGFYEGTGWVEDQLPNILSDFYLYATDGYVVKHEIINSFLEQYKNTAE